MKTINKLRSLRCSDDFESTITNLPTTDLINDTIVRSLMVGLIKTDVQALQFCDVMDNLVDSKSYIEMLRNGK